MKTVSKILTCDGVEHRNAERATKHLRDLLENTAGNLLDRLFPGASVERRALIPAMEKLIGAELETLRRIIRLSDDLNLETDDIEAND